MNANTQEITARTLETVLLQGDLSRLTPEQRLHYYRQMCERIGVDPLSQPFAYIVLNNKLTLYAKRDCTDQLRATRKISISIIAREWHESVYCVVARATDPTGRQDEALGAVNCAGLKGEALANAMMKAESKGKRRATLSLCGLGLSDESEVESIPRATPWTEPGIPTPALPTQESTAVPALAAPAAPAPDPFARSGFVPDPPLPPIAHPLRPDAATDPSGVSESQRKRLFALVREHHLDYEAVKRYMQNVIRCESSKHLSAAQYQQLLGTLESGRVRDWMMQAGERPAIQQEEAA